MASLNFDAICFSVPLFAETGLESTEMKEPKLDIFTGSASARGRKAWSSNPFASKVVRTHCDAHALLMTLQTASSITSAPLDFGAYVNAPLSVFAFKIFSERRMLGLARAYVCNSFFMRARHAAADFNEVCLRTGRWRKRSVVHTVVPTGCETISRLFLVKL